MAQIIQGPELDPALARVQIQGPIVLGQALNQDQDQELIQDQGPEPDQDHPQDIQDLKTNLGLDLTLGLEDQTIRKSLEVVDSSQRGQAKVEVMEAIEAQGVRKARGYSRLVKEKLPPNYNQPFQMILILKMKKMSQNRSLKKYQNQTKRIMLI